MSLWGDHDKLIAELRRATLTLFVVVADGCQAGSRIRRLTGGGGRCPVDHTVDNVVTAIG